MLGVSPENRGGHNLDVRFVAMGAGALAIATTVGGLVRVRNRTMQLANNIRGGVNKITGELRQIDSPQTNLFTPDTPHSVTSGYELLAVIPPTTELAPLESHSGSVRTTAE